MGTAVVNDATAAYNNPAALTLLKTSQIVALGTAANLHTQFTGQTIQASTGFLQSGSASKTTHYYLPTFYWGAPISSRVSMGVGVISNYFNSNIDDNSILRYVESSNNVRDLDVIPAVGIKVNEFFSVGAAVNVSYASFTMQPSSGFPTLDIPDSQSRNEASGTAYGGELGLLLKPAQATLIGFNYHGSMTYQLSGSSAFNGSPAFDSNQYNYIFWTPARSVLTIGQRFSPVFGGIVTIQRIQWSVFQNINIHGIATARGVVNAVVPFHLRDTWLVTVGGQYRFKPQWTIRLAGSFNQSPGNGSYQLANGNSTILATSLGYELSKKILLDAGYAHAFMQNASIHINSNGSIVNGVNRGSRDALSLKLTANFV